MADMISMLPALDKTLLANLLANARRLALDGSGKQKASAAVMLSAVEAELATRQAVEKAAKRPGRRN